MVSRGHFRVNSSYKMPTPENVMTVDFVVKAVHEAVEAAFNKVFNERQPSKKQFYTTEEFATLVGRKVETIQAWCRDNRIHAIKKKSGYGVSKEWTISHAEYERYQREGLLPNPFKYRHKG